MYLLTCETQNKNYRKVIHAEVSNEMIQSKKNALITRQILKDLLGIAVSGWNNRLTVDEVDKY